MSTKKTIDYCHTCRQMTNHGVGTNGGCLKCRMNKQPEKTVEEKWQTTFLNAGTEKGLGDLSMMISVVSDILQAERQKRDEMVDDISYQKPSWHKLEDLNQPNHE